MTQLEMNLGKCKRPHETISIHKALDVLKTGKFVRVSFVKKNGELREINGRCGVSKFTKGKGLSYDPLTKKLVVIWEANKKNRKSERDPGYRMVSLDRITSIVADGKLYTIDYWRHGSPNR